MTLEIEVDRLAQLSDENERLRAALREVIAAVEGTPPYRLGTRVAEIATGALTDTKG